MTPLHCAGRGRHKNVQKLAGLNTLTENDIIISAV